MTYAIVYSSQTGNTKLLADRLCISLTAKTQVYCGVPDDKALAAERIYMGFWTDKGTCDEVSADFLKKLRNKEVFLFGTAGFGGAPGYFEKILDSVRQNLDASCTVIGTYMCQGKMPMSVRERYVQMKAANAPVPNLDMMIENFDRALSHPDEQDLKALVEKVK